MIDIAHILALPEKERDEEIRNLIVPKPWKHDLVWHEPKPGMAHYRCSRCDVRADSKEFHDPCPIPDPIPLDWNLAMKKRDEYCNTPLHEIEFLAALEVVYIEAPDFTGFKRWIATKAQPHHYLLAAAGEQDANN